MKNYKSLFMRKLSFNTLAKSIVLAVLLTTVLFSSGQNSNNFEISKNLDIYTTLFREINKNYVDEINVGDMMKTGIDAMLESLDPYTVFIPESEVEDYKFITTGQYGGIGALIHKQGDTIVISEPYEGKPAQNYGLKAGDIILEVDNKSVSGKSTSEVSTLLKGQPGTHVDILLKRFAEEQPVHMKLTRENVKIENIPYYTIIEPNIAYIKLSGFTQNAAKEVKEAFLEMKKENELNGIILDLRNNGGGLLQEAVNIVNIFLDKGKPVVSTKGRLPSKNYSYSTTESPVDTEIPLIVLVNGSSASASEIVAGAIQDHDRGVILGQNTFGKGLVQNVIPIAYNSQAKVTVAKYYIPSGRCIQEIDYSHKDKNGDAGQIPDSLIAAFKTTNGRTVYDGHGIKPDIELPDSIISNISIALLNKFLFFSFATIFQHDNDSILSADLFTITDEIFENFIAYIEEKGYDYTTNSEKTLLDLKKTAEKEDYFDGISVEYQALADKVAAHKENDIFKYQEEIKRILRIEIVSRYYYQTGKIISSLKDDKEIGKAKELFQEKDSYTALLISNGESSSTN
jgi:carboxyl-terminal processing protease